MQGIADGLADDVFPSQRDGLLLRSIARKVNKFACLLIFLLDVRLNVFMIE